MLRSSSRKALTSSLREVSAGPSWTMVSRSRSFTRRLRVTRSSRPRGQRKGSVSRQGTLMESSASSTSRRGPQAPAPKSPSLRQMLRRWMSWRKDSQLRGQTSNTRVNEIPLHSPAPDIWPGLSAFKLNMIESCYENNTCCRSRWI